MSATYHRNAWIDPSGRVYNVPEDCGHEAEAERIVRRNGWTSAPDAAWTDCSALLFRKGWIEVSANRMHYVFAEHTDYTSSQIDTLWDMYVDVKDEDKYTRTVYINAAIRGLQRILNITVQE